MLELLAAHPGDPVGLGEIATALGQNASTCANILKTLIDRGLVEQVAPKKGYLLGATVYFLARHGPYRRDIVAAAQPVVAELSAELAEMVLVATLKGARRSILCVVHPERAVQVRDDIPYRNDVYETATGRVLLAHAAPREVEAFVAERGVPTEACWPGAETVDTLTGALERIRDEGMCVLTDREQVAQVAFPVFEGGTPLAALGVGVPLQRFDDGRRRQIVAAGRAAAQQLSEALTQSFQNKTAIAAD